MTRALLIVVAAVGACVAAACSSSSSSSGTPSDAGVDAGAGANCVPPGSPGNSSGVGAYCNTDAGCPSVADAASLICTASVSITPPNAYFCTKVGCTQDSDCGQGSYCSQQPKFNTTACIPLTCQFLDDGGL